MKLIDTWGVFGNEVDDEGESEDVENDAPKEEVLDWDSV
jgi:hypothetical protein